MNKSRNKVIYARELADGGGYEFSTTNSAKCDAEYLLSEGFLPVEEEDSADSQGVELEPYQCYQRCYRSEEGRVVKYYSVVDNVPQLINEKIESLVAELSSTDYKVIKNQEYIAAALDPEYDPAELYEARESLRCEIRALRQRLE